MAGTIKVDSINADSNLALKIANTAVAFIDATGLRPVAGNLNLDATATSKFYLPSANTVAIQTAGVTGLSISSSQVVTLANALPVTSGGTGVTTSTGTGAVVLGTSPVLTTPALGTPSALVLTNATGLPQAGLGTNVVGNGPVFSAYRSTTQSISNTTWAKVLFQTEEFDSAGYYDNATNYRFTPLIAGYYQISGAVQFASASNFLLSVYKNGVEYATIGTLGVSGLLDSAGTVSKLVYFNGSTDYVEVYCYQNSGGALNVTGRIATCYFTGVLVRSA